MEMPIPFTLVFAIIGSVGIISYFFLKKKHPKFALACLAIGGVVWLMALIPWAAILLADDV